MSLWEITLYVSEYTAKDMQALGRKQHVLEVNAVDEEGAVARAWGSVAEELRRKGRAGVQRGYDAVELGGGW